MSLEFAWGPKEDAAVVRTGLDSLVSNGFKALRGRRVGAICNPTSVDSRMLHLADLLHEAPGVELVALFGPEHGIRAEAQDMEGVASQVDRRTGVPVHSLYGSDAASLRPSPEHLDGLDVLVFDVQDVGSRYYTFAATMLYGMQAAADRGHGFLVLDRPNPLGGLAVEGPSVEPGFESFVGAYPLPIRHGMTVGELVRLFAAELALDLELDVIPCAGWTRDMLWDRTGLPWVSPSPNMPSPLTALVYPGGCLIEGTNLSEGRGTTRPFELWGAPWCREACERLATALQDDATARAFAVRGRLGSFRPMFHKFAGETCVGVQPHVTDPDQFSGLRFFVAALACLCATEPSSRHLQWRTEPYEFVRDPIAIDLLAGSSDLRLWLDAHRASGSWRPADTLDLAASWGPNEREFRERREGFLLYG